MTGAGQANALMAVAQIYRSNVANAKKRELEKSCLIIIILMIDNKKTL